MHIPLICLKSTIAQVEKSKLRLRKAGLEATTIMQEIYIHTVQ